MKTELPERGIVLCTIDQCGNLLDDHIGLPHYVLYAFRKVLRLREYAPGHAVIVPYKPDLFVVGIVLRGKDDLRALREGLSKAAVYQEFLLLPVYAFEGAWYSQQAKLAFPDLQLIKIDV